MTPKMITYLGLFMLAIGIKALLDVACDSKHDLARVVINIAIFIVVVLFIINYALTYPYLG